MELTPDVLAERVRADLKQVETLRHKISSPVVAFLGSSRLEEADPVFKHCYKLAACLAESGYIVLTGGGPGIMKAAHDGAVSVKGHVLAFDFQFYPSQETEGDFYTDRVVFTSNVGVRQRTMFELADALIFYPGGLGTECELAEWLMLTKYAQIQQKPAYLLEAIDLTWSLLKQRLQKTSLLRGDITRDDLDFLHIVQLAEESPESICRLIGSMKSSRVGEHLL